MWNYWQLYIFVFVVVICMHTSACTKEAGSKNYIFRYSKFVSSNCGVGRVCAQQATPIWFYIHSLIHLIFIIFCVWRGSCSCLLDTRVYSAITPSVTISWTHRYGHGYSSVALYSVSDISPGQHCTQHHPMSADCSCALLILDFKTMAGVLSQLFSLSPSSQQIIYLLQKCRALIWVRGPSPAASSDASHWSSFAQFLPRNCWFLFQDAL